MCTPTASGTLAVWGSSYLHTIWAVVHTLLDSLRSLAVGSELRATPSQSPGEEGTSLSSDSAQHLGLWETVGRKAGSHGLGAGRVLAGAHFSSIPINDPFALGTDMWFPVGSERCRERPRMCSVRCSSVLNEKTKNWVGRGLFTDKQNWETLNETKLNMLLNSRSWSLELPKGRGQGRHFLRATNWGTFPPSPRSRGSWVTSGKRLL